MKVLISTPLAHPGESKANSTALQELCSLSPDDSDISPFDDIAVNEGASGTAFPETLFLQSGTFDIAESVVVNAVRKWIRNGGRLVLIIGSWTTSSSGFDKTEAQALLKNLKQTIDGVNFFGRRAIEFYCVPQMNAKLSARCAYDGLAKKHVATKAMVGSTNLTSGALTGQHYELDLFFDRDMAEDAAPLDAISSAIDKQLNDFRNGIGIDKNVTARVQEVFDDWRKDQQERVAGYRNAGLPPDA